MKEYILNGSCMTTRVLAHEEIARVLELPSWYGANLDALADVLAGLHCTIRLQAASEMLNALKVYGCTMLQVFFDSPVDFIVE